MKVFRICIAVCLVLSAVQALSLHPTHALIRQGQMLTVDGRSLGSGFDLGPWRAVPIDFDLAAKYATAPQQPDQAEPAIEAGSIDVGMLVNGVWTKFTLDASERRARVYRAGQAELQAIVHPGAVHCRARYRLKAGEQLATCEVGLQGVGGFGARYNFRRGGRWDGRVSGKRRDGRVLHVLVEDAREKFPRGYRFDANTWELFLTLHADLEERDVSRAGIDDLRAYHTGVISTALVPEYAALMTDDPAIRRAAEETPVADQVRMAAASETYLSIDFWLSIDQPVLPAPPLVLLDGYTSPIWSQTTPAPALAPMEDRLLKLAEGWLEHGPRGSLVYGDFSEAPQKLGVPEHYYRLRGAGFHYFTTTESWRAFLMFPDARRWKLAKAFNTHTRDHCWRDGECILYKSLLPWACNTTSWGHWGNSEELLMSWLCDYDWFALAQYEAWQRVYREPPAQLVDREALVSVRQCRAAHWFTGEERWKKSADSIEARVLANYERVIAAPEWRTHRAGMPQGILFHPLWTERALALPPTYEGVLNVPHLTQTGQLEVAAGVLLYGVWLPRGQRVGPGLLGEQYVGLQREPLHRYFADRKLDAPHRVIYGTQNNRAIVSIDKSDDQPSTLRIALGNRRSGDTPPIVAYLTAPDGRRTQMVTPWPRKELVGAYWFYPATEQQTREGWPVVAKSIPFAGPPGRYTLEVQGEALMLHGPVSAYRESQALSGTFDWPGQDAEGKFPLGGVLVGGTGP